MSSSGSSDDTGDDSRRSDALLPSSEETAPVDKLDTVQDVLVLPDTSRSSSPSPPPTAVPGPHARLLSDESASGSPVSRALSLTPTFVSSPLNPNFTPGAATPRPRKSSRANTLAAIQRVASEDAHALAADSRRGSMILYRLASDDLGDLPSPPPLREHRASLASSSGDSVLSLSYDSKYPAGSVSSSRRGFIPYAYDPALDDKHEGPEDDDYIYEPAYGESSRWWNTLSWRGIFNIAMLVAVTCSLLALFISYPIVSFYHNGTLDHIANDNHINSTGQYDLTVQSNVRRYPLPVLEDRRP
ncbi:uncharacterized protein B0H18DRAFT_1126147 [Fomitopsis serialis]|uniref:uncharacterized protein n=1 Tax=Fomitopsis serialis TaxID=139415 RepID=UPI00200800F5|nr:uncharacterized protein B0H18DRAFT_1126147 [Neoantrodia serialis]KAH9913526.1 hypothetical protein B0H18DRAFT_1126147 [Neoantrodia serialis]